MRISEFGFRTANPKPALLIPASPADRIFLGVTCRSDSVQPPAWRCTGPVGRLSLGPAGYFSHCDGPALFRRQRELTAAQIIVCGHGEDAFVLQIDGTLFVNPGSVGMASDGRAHYAVISTETEPWHAELRSAEYESVQNPG